jgi:8-oxo-dGTP diphosphatase
MRSDLESRIRAELLQNDEKWKRRILTPRIGVAAIIESADRRCLMLIDRKYPPAGMAFPGGFVDLGESLEDTGIRESWEETGLVVESVGLLDVTSDPELDPRMHLAVVAAVFRDTGRTSAPHAGDDALMTLWQDWERIEEFPLTPRSRIILKDYRAWRGSGMNLAPLR